MTLQQIQHWSYMYFWCKILIQITLLKGDLDLILFYNFLNKLLCNLIKIRPLSYSEIVIVTNRISKQNKDLILIRLTFLLICVIIIYRYLRKLRVELYWELAEHRKPPRQHVLDWLNIQTTVKKLNVHRTMYIQCIHPSIWIHASSK